MKARLKTLVLSALGALAAFTAVTYTSCQPDKCKAIVCAYGGTCNEGECICPSGYEGVQCEIVTASKYVGTWTVFEKGTATMPAEYVLAFDEGLTSTTLNIRNFYNKFTTPVSVRIKGDSLTIPRQTIEGYEVEGWGYLKWEAYYPDHGELKVFYTVKDGNGKIDDFGVSSGEPSIWNR